MTLIIGLNFVGRKEPAKHLLGIYLRLVPSLYNAENTVYLLKLYSVVNFFGYVILICRPYIYSSSLKQAGMQPEDSHYTDRRAQWA